MKLITLSKKKKIILSTFSALIILYEWYKYKQSKKKIKSHILKLILQSNSDEFKNFYKINLNEIKEEVMGYNTTEYEHTFRTFNNSFCLKRKNSSELDFKRIVSFQNFRSLNNLNLFDCCINSFDSNQYISNIDNMLYFPSIFKIMATLANSLIYLRIKFFLGVYIKICNNIPILIINAKKEETFQDRKILIIFLGLGGILEPFYQIIKFFTQKNYIVIIPIYTSSQADWYNNIHIHEAQFYKNLYTFLSEHLIFNIEILAWSMGGIIYKGFEKYLSLCKSNDIVIKRVVLFEPLITTRAAIDTYFSQIRSYKSTLEIFNKFTKSKYRIYNLIFSYILHTELGFLSSNSVGYFSSVELKNKFKAEYPRYIFISENDLIFNSIHDEQVLKSNFDSECVFSDIGYHGNWLCKNKLLIPKLEEIIK